MKKKFKNFKLIFKYLKNDKYKLIIYSILLIIVFAPSLYSAFLWGKALEFLLVKDITNFSLYLLYWVILAILSFSVFMYITERLYNSMEVNFTKNISKDLYKKIDKLPAIAFEEIGVGEFVNRLQNDTDNIISLLSNLIRLTMKLFILFVAMIICFNISYILGIELVLFGLISGLIANSYFPKIKKEQEKIKKESDSYSKKSTENISGIREIKALGIKNSIEKDINNTIDGLFNHTLKIKNYETTFDSLNNFAYYILYIVILYTAGKLFIDGKIVYAMFTLTQTYIWRVDEVVSTFSGFGVNFNKISVSLKRIDEILNNRLYKDESYGKEELENIKGNIEFKNVNFKYKENENYTLNNLNLKIKPNMKTAIVGKSGNGKSTIFNLLLRYFDATEGEVLIDGINITELTEKSLRNNISIIRQSPFIFNTTIFNNFKYVKEDITLDEVREVCKRAYIDDYIMSLPDKYDTVIGEGGINLSGGQKQRLAIARTLLLNTKIILFDEATSALDNESQDYIMKTIDELSKDHTIVIVAHRLTTIETADIINIIDKGALVDSGTHEYLIKNSEIYKSLYTKEK